MKNVIDVPQSAESYNELLQQAVSLIESGRCFAAKQVNTAVTRTRWAIGQLLYDRKIESGHGDRIVDRLSSDLKDRYPGMGMSPRSLWDMKHFYLRFCESDAKLQRTVAVLSWTQILLLLSKVWMTMPSCITPMSP